MHKSKHRYPVAIGQIIAWRAAYVADTVLVRLDGDRANHHAGQVVAGVVESIDDNGNPRIVFLDRTRQATQLAYFAAYTEDDIEKMPDGSWCFPVQNR